MVTNTGFDQMLHSKASNLGLLVYHVLCSTNRHQWAQNDNLKKFSFKLIYNIIHYGMMDNEPNNILYAYFVVGMCLKASMKLLHHLGMALDNTCHSKYF